MTIAGNAGRLWVVEGRVVAFVKNSGAVAIWVVDSRGAEWADVTRMKRVKRDGKEAIVNEMKKCTC